MSLHSPRLVVFTDLDGTLLSHETYQAGPSIQALGLCKEAQVPVVLVSSKTRAEMEQVRSELHHEGPFISENGGGIYLPRDSWSKPKAFQEQEAHWALALGMAYAELCRILEAASIKCGARVEGFSSMSLERVVELTGLSEEYADLSRIREYDEPFLLHDRDDRKRACLQREVARAGCTLTTGGRFHHIIGGCDKGKAVGRVMGLYRDLHPGVRSMAVGDAENDLPMLREADHPFLVRKPQGDYDESAVFDGLTITQGIGPQGFLEAVQKILAAS